MAYALCDLEPTEGVSDLINELGKWSRRERKEKSEKHNCADQFSFSVDGGLVIQWGGMSEAKKDHQDEHENPSRIIEYRNKRHDRNADEEDNPALSPKEGINDVASV